MSKGNDPHYLTRFIAKLNSETSHGKLVWAQSDLKVILNDDGQIVDKIYVAKFEEKLLRIFRAKYKMYNPDFDNFYNSSYVILQLTDMGGNVDYEFPHDNAMNDLYETVRYKTSDVKKFLTKFMDEGGSPDMTS